MVRRAVDRVKVLPLIFLLMSMEIPCLRVLSYRVQMRRLATGTAGQSRKRSTELAVRRVTNSSDSLRSDAAKNPGALAFKSSPVCEAFYEMSMYFAGKARLMNAIFDTYSAGMITHHATRVWHFTGAWAADQVATFSDTIIGSFNLWLGSLWVSIDVVNNYCESTLGTCAGIVNLIFLLVSAVFIVIFFFPVFCAAVAAHAGLAGVTAWLGTHIGHMVLTIILFVWRKTMANICSIINGGRIVLSRIFGYMKQEARDIVRDWEEKTGSTFSLQQFLAVLADFERREDALEVARQALERQMMQLEKLKKWHAAAWNSTRRSWQFAMEGLSLTKDNVGEYVNTADEIVISPRHGIGVNVSDFMPTPIFVTHERDATPPRTRAGEARARSPMARPPPRSKHIQFFGRAESAKKS